MTDASEWQGRSGQSWAAEWRRTDRSFGALTERLLQHTREFKFNAALDVGCGAGELSLALGRGRPHCKVIGVDISPHLVNVAHERGGSLDNVFFEVGDAADWEPPEAFAPGLTISRHGVMFFADPVRAFGHLAAIAAPEGGLLFSCFRDWASNPVFNEVVRLLPEPPPPPDTSQPGPFAFADKAKVAALLEQAGWEKIAFEPFDFAMVVGGGDDPVGDALSYFSRIGPAARTLADLGEYYREQFADRVRVLASQNLRGGIVSLRAAAWIVSARRA